MLQCGGNNKGCSTHLHIEAQLLALLRHNARQVVHAAKIEEHSMLFSVRIATAGNYSEKPAGRTQACLPS